MNVQTKIGTKIKRRIRVLIIIVLLILSLPLIGLFTWSYLKNDVQNLNIISSQIVEQINNSFQSVIQFGDWIPQDERLRSLISDFYSAETEQEKESCKSLITNRLTELTGRGSGIQDIVLYLEDEIFHSVFIDEAEIKNIQHSDWFEDFKGKDYQRFFSPYENDSNTFSYCIPLDTVSFMSGEMVINIRGDDIISLIQTANNSFLHYVWLDNQNRPFFSESETINFNLDYVVQYSNRNRLDEDFILYDIHGVYITHVSGLTHWKLVAFVSYYELFAPFFQMFIILLISVFIIIIITSMALNPLIRNIVEPIQLLSEHMKKVFEEKTPLIRINSQDEIEELSHSFNQMTLELEKHIQLLLEKQKTEQQMKYGLLISQINPHFIYNTMNSINYLARKGRTEDIVIMNNALIHILKDSLRINEISSFDTISQEIRVVKEYLKIQSYRYGDCVAVEWNIDESILNQEIPKHMIQPIIENSLIHGFLSADSDEVLEDHNLIMITIQKSTSPEGISIKIEDNGIGIDMDNYDQACKNASDSDSTHELSRGSHIGLANIKWRLSFLLGDKQSLEISKRDPRGTTVTIWIAKTPQA